MQNTHGTTPAAALGLNIAVGAASSSAAGCVTNPIDVVKVEMQLSRKTGSAALGLAGTVRARIARQGVLSLWAGVPAMIMRSFFYAGVRLGTYAPLKEQLVRSSERPSLWSKLAAGTLSGALGAAVANPIEVVKTRMQAEPGRYRSTAAAFAAMAAHGPADLAQGLVPHVARGAVVTASQLGCYDQVKETLRQRGAVPEGVPLHLASSMIAGVVVTTCSSPVDVVKSRAMAQGGSTAEVAASVLREAGLRGFFRGWTVNVMRLAPTFVVGSTIYEQTRLLGIGYLN